MNTPPAVRILPMSRKEFDWKKASAVQREYFSQDLLEMDGRYRFCERGLDAVAGTIVLFQYYNAVVASATLLDVTRFRRPDEDGPWMVERFRVLDLMPPRERIAAIECDLRNYPTQCTDILVFHRKTLMRMLDTARLAAGVVTLDELARENSYSHLDWSTARIVFRPRLRPQGNDIEKPPAAGGPPKP